MSGIDWGTIGIQKYKDGEIKVIGSSSQVRFQTEVNNEVKYIEVYKNVINTSKLPFDKWDEDDDSVELINLDFYFTDNNKPMSNDTLYRKEDFSKIFGVKTEVKRYSNQNIFNIKITLEDSYIYILCGYDVDYKYFYKKRTKNTVERFLNTNNLTIEELNYLGYKTKEDKDKTIIIK